MPRTVLKVCGGGGWWWWWWWLRPILVFSLSLDQAEQQDGLSCATLGRERYIAEKVIEMDELDEGNISPAGKIQNT